ncbi:hypothetical protein [Bythopirellula goksoeyrii]|uniref:Uncharacterized protein n=1 Tax=Bythopirellula goksoeyrii TaxID=1400387 RepID=A0A5B9QDL5_9BACT|nr:hypothetical protein [Bythopirellula goksoeyrii]QEG35036.1 hypothetical protein Pr1d_23260 [Bythopirellula goksoeyrii]
MDRSFPQQSSSHQIVARYARCWGVTLLALAMVSTTGCIHSILATGIYLWQGGNVVPAQCSELEEQRVIVICRPPASNEYRHAGASRNVGKRISSLLAENVVDIDVVSPREVDNWVDKQDWENYKDLGRAVKADKIVYVELDNFDLYKGTTLYQGNAEVHVTVYDMNQKGKEVFSRDLGQVLFPRNSGIPSADKPVQEFERQFVEVVATQTASLFYKHDPNVDFAMDAIANR